MFCPECGTKVKDGVAFCSSCGSPIAADNAAPVTPAADPIPPVAPVQPVEPVNSGTPADNFGTVPTPPQPKTKGTRNGKKLAMIFVPIAVVLCLLIGVGCVVADKMNSPLVKIGRAFADLVTSGDANTYNISYDDDEYEFSARGDLKIDVKGKNIDIRNFQASIIDESIYKGSISDSEKNEIRNGEAFLHIDSREVGFRADVASSYQYYAYDIDQYGEYRTIFYNGYYMGYDSDGEFTSATNIFKDFSENDEELFLDKGFELVSLTFDVLNGDKSLQEVQKQAMDTAMIMFPDLEEEMPALGESQIQLNEKLVKQVKKEAVKCFTDTKWLEQNLGLTVSKQSGVTTYTFNPNMGTAARALYNIFEPLLLDIYNQASLLEEYGDIPDYEDFVDEFLSEAGEADEDYKITVTIALKGSKLSSVDVKAKEVGVKNPDTLKIHADVTTAVGFAPIDSKPYKSAGDEAKDYIDKYYRSNTDYYGYY